MLIVYVDDMIITGNDVEEIEQLKQRLSADFDIRSLGTLSYFIGIEVAHSKKCIFLSTSSSKFISATKGRT